MRSEVGQHKQLTSISHGISYQRDQRVVRSNDYVYIEDRRWRFPVLRIGINSSQTLVYAIAYRYDPSCQIVPFYEDYGFDSAFHEMSWINELLSIFDKFAADQAEEERRHSNLRTIK